MPLRPDIQLPHGADVEITVRGNKEMVDANSYNDQVNQVNIMRTEEMCGFYKEEMLRYYVHVKR